MTRKRDRTASGDDGMRDPHDRSPLLVMVAAVVATGVAAGLGGAIVSFLLRALEHLAYGYSEGSFLTGVERAPGAVRVIALGVAGLLGGVGWWALRRFGRPVVAIEDAVGGTRMPVLSTLITAALQILVVGLGASIGRELAPRLLGALAADRLGGVSNRITPRMRRTLIAAGAGAGLAAVYDVPLGGALFALEILLMDFTPFAVLAAVGASAIATVVARIVVLPTALYPVPEADVTAGGLVFALLAGLLLGLAGTAFDAITKAARRWRPRPRWQLLVMPAIFLLVGLIAVAEPSLLGNGRALALAVFETAVPIGVLLLLAVLKAIVTSATIFSGADGGTLTPSVSIGAALGAAVGLPFVHVVPGLTVALCAVIGAAAFLSGAMGAPLTAGVLLIEFTGSDTSVILPVLIAVAAAVAVRSALARRATRPERRADAAGVDGG